MNNKKGFTLVELLVAIVILGIVTALAIPLIGVIRDANTKRKYKTYLDSLVYNSKLYVDSYHDDLFKNQDSGCAYVSYENLKDRLNIKDINIDNVTCNTNNTFVKVSKLFNNYSYVGSLGCKNARVGDSIPTIFYPERQEMDDTCGVDAKAIMSFSFSPEEYTGNSKKKVSIKVTIHSNTGIDSRAKILYGFYKNSDINLNGNYKNGLVEDYTKVTKWNTLSLTIPNYETQLSQFKNGQVIQAVSKALETPQGETGQYRLVLKIVNLSDLSGVPWKLEEGEDYEYSSGLYQIDNQPPVITDFRVVSSNSNYRSNTPKLQITATDNNKYSTNTELGACFSLDGKNSCSKVVSNMKARVPMSDTTGKYHKFSDINGQTVKIFPTDLNLYDSSYHRFKIVVSDMAGNYVEKEVSYQVAQRYTLHFDENYDSATGHGKCNPSSLSVIYNPESPGPWKGGIWTQSFCSGPYRDYYHPLLQWNKKKYSKYVDWQNDGGGVQVTENSIVSNSEKELTVYAVWKPIDYSITYNLDGGTNPNNPSKYNYETPTFTLNNNTRKDYYQFIGWTGSNGNTPASVTIPIKSHGDKSYKANWRPSVARIIYHVNAGSTNGNKYVAGSDGIVRLNGSYYFHSVEYGKQTNPYNYNNPDYINISRTGYRGVSGAQWKTTSGKAAGITYNQDSNYNATDYCDMKYADCDAHLYVNWEPIPYTINYCGSQLTYNIESPSFILNNPTRDYYRFTGWTGSNGSTPQTYISIPTGSYGDKNYTCNWDPYKAYVQYNTNGGYSSSGAYPESGGWIRHNGSTFYSTVPYGSSADPYNVYTNDYFRISKTGYSEKSGAQWTNGSRTYNQDVSYSATDYCNMRTGDCYTSIYVNWEPITYTVNYCGSQLTYNIESPTFVLNNPSRDYYRFTGWTGSNGSTPQTYISIPTGSYGDKSYTCNWDPYKAYVYYNTNGGYSSSGIYPESGGWIQSNGSSFYATVPYGSSTDPYNVFTDSYFRIEKVGHVEKGGEQWTNGSRTYNQDASYSATDYCDMRYGDCNAYLYVNWIPRKYLLDVNGNLDGVYSGNVAGYGTFTVVVNGAEVATNVNDYYAYIDYGSSYSITPTATVYHRYTGADGATVSNIPANDSAVTLKYDTAKVKLYYYSEGGTLYRGSNVYGIYDNVAAYKNATGRLPTCNLNTPCIVASYTYDKKMSDYGLKDHKYTNGGSACHGNFLVDYRNHAPTKRYCVNSPCPSSFIVRQDDTTSYPTYYEFAIKADSGNKGLLESGQDVIVKLYAEYDDSEYKTFCSVCGESEGGIYRDFCS